MTPGVQEYGAAFTNGDGFFKLFVNSTGGSEMNVNASSTAPISFEVTPATSKDEKQLHISRINIKIVDNMMRWDRFGGIAALTNGIGIEQIRATAPSAVALDFSNAHSVKTNADWSLIAGVDNILTSIPGSPDLLAVRWTIANAGLPLLMTPGEILRLTINDDLSAIDSFEAMAQGIYV